MIRHSLPFVPRATVVVKVVPYVAMELVRSDEMGLFVARLVKKTIIHADSKSQIELFFVYKDPIFESQNMSTLTTHQQSIANVVYETRPLMLERGSYIPWASHFRRYLNRKRENKMWLNKAIDEGPYEFKDFIPLNSQTPRLQTEDDLTGDDLKYYEAEIEAMNLILISIPMTYIILWMLFDQFVAEPGEALVSVYNHFAQLMNDLERNGIKFPPVTVNTKLLNSLQPEWLKYVTQVRLAKRLTEDTYDYLFDYLHQYKKLVNISRAKKLEKSHDPLVIVAYTGSSSRIPSPYYVTHPSSVVDYDDKYQGDAFQNNFEDPLTSTMMLLAREITRRFSNPTNNRLRTSSNTKNQAIMQADRVNIQSRNSAKHDEVGVTLTDEQNDFLVADVTRMEEIKELSANICLMAKIQQAKIDSYEGPSYDSAFLSDVQKPSTSYVNPLFANDNHEQKYPKQPKIINDTIGDDQIDSNIIFDEPNVDVNSGSVDNNNNVQASYDLEQLARNAYKEAEKQQIIANKVKQQNIVLTK
ncbi:hypothetical protein Tco_0908471 [Tanacetum coccineum]|uniref:Uncharacterized protein n=1 Tax=Tanacetum coccineum TaxID=301880 RepID=A0ABQ5CMA7_9ASTR